MKIKVIKEENYGHVVKLTVEVDGDLIERFSFRPEQIKDGSWMSVVKQWAEKKREKHKPVLGKVFKI